MARPFVLLKALGILRQAIGCKTTVVSRPTLALAEAFIQELVAQQSGDMT